MKKRLSIIAVVLLLASVCSCNNTTGNNGESTGENAGGSTGSGDVEATTEQTEEYVFADLDLGGEEVTVANLEKIGRFNMCFVMDPDVSDTLDVAVYESNMRIQDEYNFVLTESRHPLGNYDTRWLEFGNWIMQNFMAGDDVFDFIFYPVGQRPELIAREYIYDLSEFDEQLQLDQPWWDTQLNDNITINGRLYMASGAINLMAYDGMEGLIFNKQILVDNGLDNPYDMVREGTWTIDALYALASETITLGSDANWYVKAGQGGTSVFGTGLSRDFPAHFLTSAGIQFVTETNGDYNLTLESEDFYTAIDKLTPLFTSCGNGGVGGGDASTGDWSRMTLFGEGRVAFAMTSVEQSFELRGSEIEYGFLPLPKLREEQENYITSVYDRLHFIAIPTQSTNPENVATVLDALAYDRYKNVVPVYYDTYITYKGVRDEDSLEMLEIMTAGRTIDIGIAYGWCHELVVEQISWNFPSSRIASTVASYKDTINEDIDLFVNNYFN